MPLPAVIEVEADIAPRRTAHMPRVVLVLRGACAPVAASALAERAVPLAELEVG